MKFFAFHLMPWPHLPPDYEGDLLTHAAGGAKLVTLPRCGHLPVLEQPEALVREISAFVEQHPISRR